MKPRLWLLLSLFLACGLFLAAASAAHARVQLPPKSSPSDGAPLTAQALPIDQDSSAVSAVESESDYWDMHSVFGCYSSAMDWGSADYFLILCVPCARGGAPSLVNQGVRLQI